jgi:deoxyguanosine kinase
MAKVLIIEGHRLTGKSTICRYLRNNVNYSTLINPTGFPDRGEKGLHKISLYYQRWVNFLSEFKDEDILFIFDRFMFSEVVYSRLYKDYDFYKTFRLLFEYLVQNVDMSLVFLEMTDEEELMNRAKREKTSFADVKDNLVELYKQREGYSRLYDEIRDMQYDKLKLYKMCINGYESKEVAKKIMELL